MDDEVITWNLKGPKRMKKRKELNALIKNNVKYKSLSKKASTIDAYNMSSYACSSGVNGRLLNYNTTSEDEEYFFQANKTTIREKKRNYYCKIIQMILIGCFITFCLLIGIILLFSYSKFHEVLNDLKKEVASQNDQNIKNYNGLRDRLDQYDIFFKQFKEKQNNIKIETVTTVKQKAKRDLRSKHDTSEIKIRDELTNSIKSIHLANRLNYYLIEWLFNNTGLNPKKANEKLKKSNFIKKIFNLTNSQNLTNNFKYLVDDFLKKSDENFNFNESIHFLNDKNSNLDLVESYFDQMKFNMKANILEEIQMIYLKPIVELLDKCDCEQIKNSPDDD